ncbi:cyclin-dependent kinase 15-like [Lineus longissimus]|uniref:cyclin-dependent kinase 15-like n=1 Tax=Lineus longissimus TaxID=88925 RepID=UPI00315C60D9
MFKRPVLRPVLVNDREKERRTLIQHLTEDLPKSDSRMLNILGIIGHGSYGKVHLCKKNGQHVVLKELIDCSDEKNIRLIIKEARLLNSIRHPNIVQFNSVFHDSENGSLPMRNGFIMEYVHFSFKPLNMDKDVSSLTDFLNIVDQYDGVGFEHVSKFIAKDIVSALAFLHSKDVVHRDLQMF